jgi:hypothetical protein
VQGKPAGDISLDTPAGCADNNATAVAALCFLEPDLLVLELSASVGTPVWVDPMLEELVASLVVSRLGKAQAPGCPLTSAVASQDANASWVDTCSPAKAA